MSKKKSLFREYDSAEPLISLHVPKCAGSGFWLALHAACEQSFRLLGYYPDINLHLPEDWNGPNTIIHGHFIRRKGHSVESVCPGAHQYITVLRDPFDICVSAYFYGLKENMNWATSSTIKEFLGWWLAQDQGPILGSLPALTGATTLESYIADFVCIGVMDEMEKFYSVLGNRLKVNFSPARIVNSSSYSNDVPDMRNEFRKKFPLDYDLFDFIRQMQ